MERNLTKSEITVGNNEIHFCVRYVAPALTKGEDFESYCSVVKAQAEQLRGALEPFFTQHQSNTYNPVLNAVDNKLVFRCDGSVSYLCNPFGEHNPGNFTAPGNWKKVRNAIRRFDSKIQIFKS